MSAFVKKREFASLIVIASHTVCADDAEEFAFFSDQSGEKGVYNVVHFFFSTS